MGSGTADDPLLAPVLAAPEQYPNAGERRLLYAAMTGARRRVFLPAEGGPPSPFVRELIGGDCDAAVFGSPPKRTCLARNASKAGWGAAGTRVTAAPSTVARTGPTANTRSRRARSAARGCP